MFSSSSSSSSSSSIFGVGVGIIYDRTGVQSSKSSTVKTRIHGIGPFNDFLKSLKVSIIFDERKPDSNLKQNEDAENYFCKKEFWQWYGTYLKDFATKKNSEDFFSSGA